MSGKEEVEAAVASAEKAFGHWSGLTAKSRAAIMFRFHALLEKHAEELVMSVERIRSSRFTPHLYYRCDPITSTRLFFLIFGISS